jgi:hypothetical protein
MAVRQPFRPLWSRPLLHDHEPSRASVALCFKSLLMSLLPASGSFYWISHLLDISLRLVPTLLTCPAWETLLVAMRSPGRAMLRRLVAGSHRGGPGSIPVSVYVGFVVDKVAVGQVFSPEYFGFPLSISFHRCSITWKKEKKTDHLSSSSQGCTRSHQAAVCL